MKKLLITLLVAGALIGAVYGAAAALSINGVDDLGSGQFTVVSPDNATTEVTDLVWTIDPNDISLVSAAAVELTGDSGDAEKVCDVGLKITDGADIFNGVNTAVTIPADSPYIVSTSFNLVGALLDAAGIDTDGVTITLACEN